MEKHNHKARECMKVITNRENHVTFWTVSVHEITSTVSKNWNACVYLQLGADVLRLQLNRALLADFKVPGAEHL